ncbi:MAG: hypothetical protein GNW80_16590 [Asgard group archaeon]|nr:hypothetical protein [Asgard group archaeon]
MPIKTSESKFELEPYGFSQMLVIFTTLTVMSVISIICGILFRHYNGTWVLYIFAGIVFLLGCVLFLLRYRKMRAGTLVKITLNAEGIKQHSTKAGTIKFISWEDSPDFSVSMADFVDTEEGITVEGPAAILITGKNDSITIDLEEYATLLTRGDKIVKGFEQAFKDFRKKYRKSSK